MFDRDLNKFVICGIVYYIIAEKVRKYWIIWSKHKKFSLL